MRILVTGASGFVGRHLIHFLKTKRCVLFGTFRNHRIPSTKKARFYRCNFAQFEQVLALIRKTKPTHIFHLVGQGSPALSWKHPFETIKSNTYSLIHLLEACRQSNLKPRILFVSSAHVYGKIFEKRTKVPETAVPEPIEPYGATKLHAEHFAIQYWQQFGIPSLILRTAAHIGPEQPPVFAISNFAKQIAEIEQKKRRPVILVGPMTAERGFVSIHDMVRAYWLGMTRGKIGEIYNIGAKRIRPMGEWLALVKRLTPARFQIKLDPERKNLIEAKRIFVDSTKFRRATGWAETVSELECIREILAWWRQHV